MSFPDEAIARWGEDRGQPRPAGPDPERDARVEAYRDRERRKVSRALDRLLDLTVAQPLAFGDRAVANERFIEAVGDYVLSRLHHNRHYVVPAEIARQFGMADQMSDVPAPWDYDATPQGDCLCTGERPHPEMGMQPGAAAAAHKSDSGAADE